MFTFFRQRARFTEGSLLIQLSLFNLKQYGRMEDDGLHASGHTSGKEIVEMISAINPKKIVPIRTKHLGHIKNYFENAIRVEQGEILKL